MVCYYVNSTKEVKTLRWSYEHNLINPNFQASRNFSKEFGKCEIIISLWLGLCEKEALFRLENVKIDNI